jgi:hypothetical protein
MIYDCWHVLTFSRDARIPVLFQLYPSHFPNHLTPRSTPDVTLDVENDARAEAIQGHRQFVHVRQALAYGALPFYRADDKQETAAARAGQLGARCPGIERPLYCHVYLGIGYAGG